MKDIAKKIMLFGMLMMVAISCATSQKTTASMSQHAQEEKHSAVELNAMAIATQMAHAQQELTYHAQVLEMIPLSKADILVPMESLLDLPDNGQFTATQGQASVTLQRTGNNIVATGLCDSIARISQYWQSVSKNQQYTIDSLTQINSIAQRDNTSRNYVSSSVTTEETKAPSTVKVALAGFGAGVVVTGVAIFAKKLLV